MGADSTETCDPRLSLSTQGLAGQGVLGLLRLFAENSKGECRPSSVPARDCGVCVMVLVAVAVVVVVVEV